MNCKNCNYELKRRDNFCPQCGIKCERQKHSKGNKKRNFFILMILIFVIVGYFCKEKYENAAIIGTKYFPISNYLVRDIPYDGTYSDMKEWLDGGSGWGKIYYKKDELDELNQMFNIRAMNGWNISIHANVMEGNRERDGIVIFCSKNCLINSEKFFEECVNATKYLNSFTPVEPTRYGDTYAWFDYGDYIIGVLKFDNTIQVQIGADHLMHDYL